MGVVGGDTSGEEAVADENPCVVAPLHDVQGGQMANRAKRNTRLLMNSPVHTKCEGLHAIVGSHWKDGEMRQSAVL